MVREKPCEYYTEGMCRAPLDTNPRYRREWEDRLRGNRYSVCMNPKDSEMRRCQDDVNRQERDNQLMDNPQ